MGSPGTTDTDTARYSTQRLSQSPLQSYFMSYLSGLGGLVWFALGFFGWLGDFLCPAPAGFRTRRRVCAQSAKEDLDQGVPQLTHSGTETTQATFMYLSLPDAPHTHPPSCEKVLHSFSHVSFKSFPRLTITGTLYFSPSFSSSDPEASC